MGSLSSAVYCKHSLYFNDSLKNVGGPEDFHDFHIIQESRDASSWKGGKESGDVKWTPRWVIQGKTHQTWQHTTL